MEKKLTVYGIKNCDTVKKALTWLQDRKVAFDFHDYKTKGVNAEKLTAWIAVIGWERLVNKKGLTWKQLTEKEKNTVIDEKSAIDLMTRKTSVIKRPLIERNGKVLLLGFDASEYESKFVK